MRRMINTDALITELTKMRDDYDIFAELTDERDSNFRIEMKLHYAKLAEMIDYVIELVSKMEERKTEI